MSKRFLPILIVTGLLVFGSSPAAALILDANVLGIFTDSALTDPVDGATIDPSGDVATAPLATGDWILLGVDVSNPEADSITGLFATLTYQGDELMYWGAQLPPTMLKGPDPSDLSMIDVNTGDLKGSQPNNLGEPGDIWIQVVSYALQVGASGTGPIRSNFSSRCPQRRSSEISCSSTWVSPPATRSREPAASRSATRSSMSFRSPARPC